MKYKIYLKNKFIDKTEKDSINLNNVINNNRKNLSY